MIVTAIDPGNEESAYCIVENGRPVHWEKISNDELLGCLPFWTGPIVYEMIASYGMGVGKEIFDTCIFIGRMLERAGQPMHPLTRIEVKIHHCHTARATDSNIRHALCDRFGGKIAAIGKKASPGPLFGMKADCWSAFAIALTYYDRNKVKNP